VWWEIIAATDCLTYFLDNMFAKHYENPTMLSKVTAKNVEDVFFETHCRYKYALSNAI